MSLLNWWSGNNTSKDSVGAADLTWVGSPDYGQGCFKLNTSGGFSSNYLVFPNFPISEGQPFSFEGKLWDYNNHGFPHICVPDTGLGQDASHGFAFLFDFSEGFCELIFNDTRTANTSWVKWFFGIAPNSYQVWNTWKLTYDGDTDWKLYINSDLMDLTERSETPIRFNGLFSLPNLTLINWGDFGDGYILAGDLKFYDDCDPQL